MNFQFLRNVLLKGLVLFLLVDLVYSAVNPADLGKVSLYNYLFAGRLRFPFGEDSAQSYNLSLFNLNAMFASHIIAGGPKPGNEYRIITIGDSSTWGTLLHPEETLAGQLDKEGLSLCGKVVRVYNLGYPTISLTKDLMILDFALHYQPDLLIWLMSMEAFHTSNQLSSPIVANNFTQVEDLINRYNLPLNPNETALVHQDFWDNTIIGQRRALADLLRLQIYGVMWSATRIDQTYPTDYQHAQTDLSSDITYHNMKPPTLDASQLAFGLVDAGLRIAKETPMILINEPMLISDGKNSNLRYNFIYPRWAYDQWRVMMSARAKVGKWNYLDLWNIVPPDEFTNSAIHLTPAGESILTGRVKNSLLQQSCP